MEIRIARSLRLCHPAVHDPGHLGSEGARSGAGGADPFVATALRFLDRTEPMLGVGAGVAFTGGPVTLDLGYRYKRMLASDSLPSLLVAGDDIDVSQVRIGIGFRF